MKKIKSSLLIFFIAFLNCLSVVRGQEFSKVKVPFWQHKDVAIGSNVYIIPKNMFDNGRDHTAVLQKILNTHRDVLLPNMSININSGGLVLKSESKIYFQRGSILKMIPNAKGSYAVLKLYNVKNVQIFNARIIGDRTLHKGKSGEWGMGIDIRSSSNIIVNNPFIKDAWGDGIYLGLTNGGSVNSQIQIRGGLIDYSRRNGISVTSGKNIYISDISIYNTFGTKPMAGIDIEPNVDSHTISDIIIENVKTYNSGNEGILLYLSNLRGTANKNSDIKISNHQDYGSKIGLRVGPISAKNASGIISVSNSNWSGNRESGLKLSDFSPSAVKLNLNQVYFDGKAARKEQLNLNKNRVGKNISIK